MTSINTAKRVFSVTDAGYTITVEASIIGRDVLLVVTGGTHPHIGTVTTLSAGEEVCTRQFISTGDHKHKDHYVAEVLAECVRDVLQGTCVITAGIHVDRITSEQLAASHTMAERLGNDVREWIASVRYEMSEPVYTRPSAL